MWLILTYFAGQTHYWDGRDWVLDKNKAHLWHYKRDAEDIAAFLPKEGQVTKV